MMTSFVNALLLSYIAAMHGMRGVGGTLSLNSVNNCVTFDITLIVVYNC